MNNRYKLIISNRTVYEEIDVNPEAEQFRIGTGIDCDYRLRKESFFGKFELLLSQKNGAWSIRCPEELYIAVGDVRKRTSLELSHGSEFTVKYSDTDTEILKGYFTIDFEYDTKDYSKIIDISNSARVSIGATRDCDICLPVSNLGKDRVELTRDGNGLVVTDCNTQYGVFLNGAKIRRAARVADGDFISVQGVSMYYKGGKLYADKNIAMELNGLQAYIYREQQSHFTYPDFNRNTRIQYVIPDEEIEIKQPPQKPQKNKRSIWLMILPPLAMLILLVVVRGFMSGGSGGSFILYSAGSMGVGLIVSILTYRSDKKRTEQEIIDREESYRKYIAEKEALIQESRRNELRIRENIYSSISESLNEVRSFEKRLFEKSKEDKDFLDVYLGRGRVEAACKVKFSKQEFVDPEDPITLLPEQIEEKYRYIDNAPIIAHLNSSNGVGVVGDPASLHEAIKNITLDITLRHFYKDVKCVYMLDENELDSLSWLRWLRHVHNDELNIRNIICDDESRKVLMDMLYSELSSREAEHSDGDNKEPFDTYYVVFVRDASQITNHPISKYVEKCNKYGFTFVFFEEYEEFLPKGCTEIIHLGSHPGTGAVLKSENGDEIFDFESERISDQNAEYAAVKIGAVRVPEVSLESQLTRSITMYELLNIMSADDLDLGERWNRAQVYKTMAAPLGVKAKNEVVYLDISDKGSAHGPHGLVAGTTGSGKSEILQTYVLSMATLFHPYEVGFVIIDFKGGGMANQFKDLPHLMGTITNIDGREITRSLLSTKAELVKRQTLFAAAGVNHINDYIKLYKKGEVTQPLPHLIMIVDEFAELKAEYPDFMKEIISAARIGRTLGIHLILATQKPAGVVDNQIWSNSKFKLCLKVQTKEDSNEVIKTPLAAEIKEPGRAYFQVGNNEVFELFQSAYSGAKVTEGSSERPVELYELNKWGKRKLVYTNKTRHTSDDAPTELEELVEHVHDYCLEHDIRPLPGICLPPLPDTMRADKLSRFQKDICSGVIVPVGMFDDPENQLQGNYEINFSSSNTYIIGSPQSGKTTLLQTIMLQIMKTYTPSECNIYIVDCGGMALKSFEGANHVGGVVLANEEERMSNLFKMMVNLIQQRKEKFAEKGLGTYSAYVEAGFRDVPQVLLIIDNLAAFKEYYSIYDDRILMLSREGQSVGINMIVTATQTNTLNYKTLSNYGNRVAFTCNDTGEYTNLFDRCRMAPKDVPGRALCSIEKHIVEFQTALSVYGDKEIERVQNIKATIDDINRKYGQERAMPIPTVPEVLKRSELMADNRELYRRPYMVPIAMDYDTVDFVSIDLTKIGSFAVCGGANGNGKNNVLMHLLSCIQLNVLASRSTAWVIDSNEMKLEAACDFGYVEKYSVDAGETEGILNDILDELETRQREIAELKIAAESYLADKPLLLLVVNNSAFYSNLAGSKELQQKMLNILKVYGRLKVAVVFGAVENMALNYNSPEILKYIKDNGKIFMLDDIGSCRFVDVSSRDAKEHIKPLKPGDMFMMFGNITRVKMILDE